MTPGKKYMKKPPAKSQVKEPAAIYQTADRKELSIYNSFEEAAEAEYKYLASLSGEEHLANAVTWIKRLYAKELKKHPKIGTDLRVK